MQNLTLGEMHFDSLGFGLSIRKDRNFVIVMGNGNIFFFR